MHQELSKRDKVSVIKLGLMIMIVAIILTLINVGLVAFDLNSSFTDIVFISITAILTYLFIKQNMISYKYSLIEDDFIIYEVLGSKEKPLLNMNVHQIITFKSIKEGSYEVDNDFNYTSKKKLYNCVNITNRHYLIYEDSGEKRLITIQPSDYMIGLIKERMNG